MRRLWHAILRLLRIEAETPEPMATITCVVCGWRYTAPFFGPQGPCPRCKEG